MLLQRASGRPHTRRQAQVRGRRQERSQNMEAFGRIDAAAEDDNRYMIRRRWPGTMPRALPEERAPGDLASLQVAAKEIEADLGFSEHGKGLPVASQERRARRAHDAGRREWQLRGAAGTRSQCDRPGRRVLPGDAGDQSR